MRTLIKTLLFLMISVQVHANPSIVGKWQLVGMIYRGVEIPPLNPHLNLSWTFFSNGTDRLYWDRDDETGFCERFANYQITGNQLQETVFATNPLNNANCAQDPDMQLGRQTSNRFEIKQNQIHLYLQLADEDLIYILKETP